MNAKEIAEELRVALAEHEAAWAATKDQPLAGLTGPVRAANERIGRALWPADRLIIRAGKWPENRPAIGNDERLRLLDQII